MTSRIRFFLLIILFLLISVNLYRFVFGFYFFQDDWFNFNITRINNFNGYLSFFKFRDDIIIYRPIALQTFFFLFKSIFGFNSFALRMINFGFLSVTYLLIMNLLSRIAKNKITGFLAASFWVISSIHFMNLGVINYNLIGTFFWIITFLFFIKFIESQKSLFYILSLIFYLFTIGSFEFVVTWPIIAGFYYCFIYKGSFSKLLKIFSPFIILTMIYLILRQIFIKPLPIIEYKIAFNLDSIKAFFWYSLWVFNIPEEFKKQIVKNLIVFNETFLRDYWLLVFKIFIGAIGIILLGVLFPLYKLLKEKSLINFRIIIFSIFWFCVAIFPVLLLPNHTFIMYLTLASIGPYFLVAYLVNLKKDRFLIYLTMFIWFFLSFTTINFYKNNSYVVEAQNVSRQFSVDVRKQAPILSANSMVYYPLPYKQQRQALLDQNAIKAVYGDSSLSIYYDKVDLLEALNKSGNRPIYYISHE